MKSFDQLLFINVKDREEILQQSFTELKGLECQLAESQERERNLKVNVHRLTADTSRQDEEITQLRSQLETTDAKLQVSLTAVLVSLKTGQVKSSGWQYSDFGTLSKCGFIFVFICMWCVYVYFRNINMSWCLRMNVVMSLLSVTWTGKSRWPVSSLC